MDLITLSSKSLVDLKKLAKGRRIKQYYIMKRHDLIRILSLPELPQTMILEKLTITHLRAKAKEKGLHGFWTLNRQALLELLYPAGALEKKNQDGTDPEKHKEPQSCDSDEKGHQKL